MTDHLIVMPNATEIAQKAVIMFREAVQHTLESRKQKTFSFVLSGGSTPAIAYKMLAELGYEANIPWSRIHIFWGDERGVPAGHSRSNFGMAKELFLDQLPIPQPNIHRIKGEENPEAAARSYEEEIRRYFHSLGKSKTVDFSFDLVWLGLGVDGHTASIFPGQLALFSDRTSLVNALYEASQKEWRITMTPALLNRADRVCFLVAGAEKAQTLAEVLKGNYHPDKLPAQMIRPAEGELTWLLDSQAAALVHPD